MNVKITEETKSHIPPPLTKEEIQEAVKKRISNIDGEFAAAFNFLESYPRSVTFFGSSRFTQDNQHCQDARRLAGRIAKELGYTVMTGGSAGIMEAANQGAFEAGGQSVGLNIRLPHEQGSNKYTTASIEFSYFFVRKLALSFSAEAYLFFPGGFGTLDEFFEVITLIQTHKIRRIPVFLVGKDYWDPLQKFIREHLFEAHGAIASHDLDLYRLTDNDDEILEAIRTAPVFESGFHHHHPEKHGTGTD